MNNTTSIGGAADTPARRRTPAFATPVALRGAARTTTTPALPGASPPTCAVRPRAAASGQSPREATAAARAEKRPAGANIWGARLRRGAQRGCRSKTCTCDDKGAVCSAPGASASASAGAASVASASGAKRGGAEGERKRERERDALSRRAFLRRGAFAAASVALGLGAGARVNGVAAAQAAETTAEAAESKLPAGATPCAECSGGGSIPCELCQGTGFWRALTANNPSQKYKGVVCPECNGNGDVICSVCLGTGEANVRGLLRRRKLEFPGRVLQSG